MLRCARHLAATTGMRHLVLAGGVALNCVGNGRILQRGSSRTSGSSRLRGTPGAPWAPRCSSGTKLGPLYRALTALSLPVGFVVSHAVMGILFFGVLTPIGLLFRLTGRDRLARTREADRSTYWEPCAPAASVERYYRQF
jgi:hypothetical protein